MNSFFKHLPEVDSLRETMPRVLPVVCFCTSCKRRRMVDPAVCVSRGWPMCCGRTMHLAAPGNLAGIVEDLDVVGARLKKKVGAILKKEGLA